MENYIIIVHQLHHLNNIKGLSSTIRESTVFFLEVGKEAVQNEHCCLSLISFWVEQTHIQLYRLFLYLHCFVEPYRNLLKKKKKATEVERKRYYSRYCKKCQRFVHLLQSQVPYNMKNTLLISATSLQTEAK